MTAITTTYSSIWRISFAHEYEFTKDCICINSRRGKIVRMVLKSGCRGYNIKGRFYSLQQLRSHLEKIPKDILPF